MESQTTGRGNKHYFDIIHETIKITKNRQLEKKQNSKRYKPKAERSKTTFGRSDGSYVTPVKKLTITEAHAVRPDQDGSTQFTIRQTFR